MSYEILRDTLIDIDVSDIHEDQIITDNPSCLKKHEGLVHGLFCIVLVILIGVFLYLFLYMLKNNI